MIVVEAFRPDSTTEAVVRHNGRRAEALCYALGDISHTILPDRGQGR